MQVLLQQIFSSPQHSDSNQTICCCSNFGLLPLLASDSFRCYFIYYPHVFVQFLTFSVLLYFFLLHFFSFLFFLFFHYYLLAVMMMTMFRCIWMYVHMWLGGKQNWRKKQENCIKSRNKKTIFFGQKTTALIDLCLFFRKLVFFTRFLKKNFFIRIS